MKNIKIILLVTFCILLSACTKQQNDMASMVNPWKYCNDDLACAEKIAQLKFPVKMPGIQVRAMDGMIEVLSFLGGNREITIRKAHPSDTPRDISGDYNRYPNINEIKLKNGAIIQTKGVENIIYVMNFYNSKGNYSVRCAQGMTFDEALDIYIVVSQVEIPNFKPSDVR